MSMEQDQSGYALLDMWYKLIVMIGISVFIVTKSVEMFELSRNVTTDDSIEKLEEILLNIDQNISMITKRFLYEAFLSHNKHLTPSEKREHFIFICDEVVRSIYLDRIKKNKQKGSN